MPTLPFRQGRIPGELGDVDAYTAFDLNVGYRIPGLTGVSAHLDIQNLFDNEHRTFVGTPLLGRLAMVRLRYEF
jgi:outer membrane receptor protein involved in Fe transport